MRISRRSVLAIGVVALLGALALLGKWYETTRTKPGRATDHPAVSVTSGADRGPGSLREALFVAAAAEGKAGIAIQVARITLESALPPLANPHGISIAAREPGTEIDAQALKDGPVFDVAGADSSISGVRIRNCAGAAVLVRSVRFRLDSTAIEACEVGVEVAENAADLVLERNRFTQNRVAVRFAAANKHITLANNEFAQNKDAGVWAVRGEPDLRNGTIEVRDNTFNKERAGMVVGNIAILLERNQLNGAREAAIHLLGAGAVVRGNRISGGDAMGIVVENASAAVVEGNELDRVAAYGVMVRGSANALVRGNRIQRCGYGMAFVLNDARSPNTAVENTIIEPQYNGIDVIGDSPILRRNRVLQAHALALHVEDFKPQDGAKVPAHPFLDNNSFATPKTTVSSKDSRPIPDKARPQ